MRGEDGRGAVFALVFPGLEPPNTLDLYCCGFVLKSCVQNCANIGILSTGWARAAVRIPISAPFFYGFVLSNQSTVAISGSNDARMVG